MKLTSFGELMLRFKPADCTRIIQATSFEVSFGGAESNVAVSLSLLGDQSSFITKLPQNMLGEAALYRLRGYGVDTTKVLRGGQRIGTYYFEKGTSIRGTNVIYDRAHSSFATSTSNDYDWKTTLKDTDYFYVSGITPALSTELQKAVLKAASYCQQHHIKVVYDANYRGKLWSPEESQAFSEKMMPYVSIVFAHDEDFESSFGIKAFDGDMTNGIAQKKQFKAAMTQLTERYPNLETVGSVLRNIYTVEKSQWSAILLQNNHFYDSPVYPVDVYEGVGGGDAFAAGIMHGFLNQYDPQKQINFGIAASVTKLTISGDFNLAYSDEISKLAERGGAAMNR
ncbi:MAG: sugar kinase [Lentilactobacillus hilgardii]|uniref:sugar kinase n=1 Tax=Lentilactobacillus hilgardii TaxID=1588 RepID=UPI001CC1D211|nr:sugar kinase [Lentilactobacillus hilgardii]MBZ2200675.1 2-dehydro-3-deoxygluconokinase [Lentilactobacillus hilgardii]MBZ2203344.1 sugar kinase [Lentilactobacillus hilgardii]